MIVEIKVPEFAESISEGTLLDWMKKPGEKIARDEVLIEIETDKVVLEVPSLTEGVIVEVLAKGGETVVSGQVIARVDTEGVAGAALEVKTPSTPANAATNEPGHGGSSEGNTVADGSSSATDTRPSSVNPNDLSPAVRKLVAETGMDPAVIAGTGKGGKVTKGDVLEHQREPAAALSSASVRTPVQAPVQAKAPAPTISVPQGGNRLEQRVPMTRIRARIAQRLKEVQNTAAILTTFNEVNMAPIMELRKKYQEQFVKKHGIKLGFMSFFVRAVTEALKAYPAVNASIDGQDIVYHSFFDIGIAVSSERGLVVPILRDTDSLGLADIEKEIGNYAVKAKNNKLTLEDMSGGTFSITNGGTFGSMLSTPILNQPQSAILGMHNIVERAVVEDGQIVVRPIMYLALSYDHRIIDGREAVLFLVTIKNLLEDPARLLLDL